jgi:solute carrier family 5 (sodium-coupled monocarboxylate transporter), member 8/12
LPTNYHQKFIFFSLNPNPLERHTFWTVTIGQFFYILSWSATSQGMVQRYLAVPDLRTARFCLLLYALGMMAVKGLSVATGLLLYATYEGCDPISAKVISNTKTQKPRILQTLTFCRGCPGRIN